MGRRLVHKLHAVVFTGLAALAGTTFQNGCTTSDLYTLSGMLDEFSSEYGYSDPYAWDYGYYETPANPLAGWEFGDVKSG